MTADDIEALASWDAEGRADARRSPSRPRACCCRTSPACPRVVDLAAMRDAMADARRRPGEDQPARAGRARHRPLGAGRRVRHWPTRSAINAELEFERNQERYAFLRWGQQAFENFTVVPPDTGIVHQVNLEYLARVVFVDDRRRTGAYPDTLVGTDSHTTMVNGLGVLGWGVGGIEAEAAMLGQPMSMLHPAGRRLQAQRRAARGRDGDRPRADRHADAAQEGRRRASSSSSTARARARCRSPTARRSATWRPEYGATCAIFPIDAETLRYLAFTGRPRSRSSSSRRTPRRRASGTTSDAEEPTFTDTLELDLGDVEPSLAGPKRPQDRVPLTEAQESFREALMSTSPEIDDADEAAPSRFPSGPAGDRTAAATAATRRAAGSPPAAPCRATAGEVPVTLADGRRDRARPRPRRDRRDHELHEHVEPVGDARRRPARARRRSRRA